MACALVKDLLSKPRHAIRVVGSAVDVAGTLEAVEREKPDVVLVSAVLQEGPRAGLGILAALRSAQPRTKTMLLMDHSERELVVEAFRNGARGVFFRTDPLAMLPKAIRSVHLGQVWASSPELQFLLEELGRNLLKPVCSMAPRNGVHLTDRELQVVRLVTEGYTNREISQTLGLSEHTVKNYIFRVFDKTGVSTRVELVLYTLSKLQSEAGPGKVAI